MTNVSKAVRLDGALLRIPIDQIVPGPNARGALVDLQELATSLIHIGQQNPLIVSPLEDGRYQLLDGHRRHAAARLAGLATMDAVLRRERGPAARLQQQLAIHTNARSFDPIAEAHACHQLMFEHKLSREQIAAAIGRSPLWVRDRVALVHLTTEEKTWVAAGRMSLSEALGVLAARRAGPAALAAAGRARHDRAVVTRRGTKHCATCRCNQQGALL